MTKRPFKAKGNRATKQLGLVHTDVCGLMSVQDRGGKEYFITFTNDYLGYRYVYLMGHKSEAFESFENIRLRQKSNWASISSSFGLTKAMNTYLENSSLIRLNRGQFLNYNLLETPQENEVFERRDKNPC